MIAELLVQIVSPDQLATNGTVGAGWIESISVERQFDLTVLRESRTSRAFEDSRRWEGEDWWRCPGLNGRPAAYESAALPTELHRHLVVFAEEMRGG